MKNIILTTIAALISALAILIMMSSFKSSSGIRSNEEIQADKSLLLYSMVALAIFFPPLLFLHKRKNSKKYFIETPIRIILQIIVGMIGLLILLAYSRLS